MGRVHFKQSKEEERVTLFLLHSNVTTLANIARTFDWEEYARRVFVSRALTTKSNVHIRGERQKGTAPRYAIARGSE